MLVMTAAKLVLRRGVVTSYSQRGEDVIAAAQLRGVRGVYVDVGAYHPVLYSNTYALYRRGWHGIVIDPNATLYPLYRVFRPRDQFAVCGVGETEAEQTYYTFSDGAYNTFDAESAEALQASPRAPRLLGTHTVPISPLSTVLKKYNVTHIDLLNIDTEGFDYTVIKSHDWSIRPRVIIIEDHNFNPDQPHNSDVYSFLHGKQYRLAGLSGETLIFRTDV